MYPFDYCRVAGLDEALSILANEEDVRPLAGGMSLIPTLRHRLASVSKLVDLNGLADLRGIFVTDKSVRIGAMTTHYAVSASEEVKSAIPALAALAGRIGDPLVRNRGTIGGSLANNDPAACYPSALLGLGGTVQTDRRTIPGDEFILGMFETALEPGEMIVAAEFPIPDRAAHMKFENFASRFSIVGIFLSRAGTKVRVGVTGASSCAFRATALESALEQHFVPDALDGILLPAKDLLSDVHADADYRSHLITELTKRAVAQCLTPATAR